MSKQTADKTMPLFLKANLHHPILLFVFYYNRIILIYFTLEGIFALNLYPPEPTT